MITKHSKHKIKQLERGNLFALPPVEYGSWDWRPSILLRWKVKTHCIAQFHKPANEQVVVLPKAYKYSSEQKNDF